MNDVEERPESDRLSGACHPRFTPQVFGHDDAAQVFLDAYNAGRLHHAWLISGAPGIGKATLAWAIARFLLLRQDNAPVETLDHPVDHPDLALINALSHPGLALYRRAWDVKDARFNQNISVDDIRALKSAFALKATKGAKRVVIIDAADDMNRAAGNALLKLLEEPPDDVVILLVVHRPHRLLPTIKSRCLSLKCAPLADDALLRALRQAGFDPARDLGAVTALAGGSVGAAIALLQGDGLQIYADIVALFAKPGPLLRPQALALADACAGPKARERYVQTEHLIALFLNRLCTSCLTGLPGQDAAQNEREIMTRLCHTPTQARRWAALAGDVAARMNHARAVNLDPASVILDTLLKIDHEAGALLSV